MLCLLIQRWRCLEICASPLRAPCTSDYLEKYESPAPLPQIRTILSYILYSRDPCQIQVKSPSMGLCLKSHPHLTSSFLCPSPLSCRSPLGGFLNGPLTQEPLSQGLLLRSPRRRYLTRVHDGTSLSQQVLGSPCVSCAVHTSVLRFYPLGTHFQQGVQWSSPQDSMSTY